MTSAELVVAVSRWIEYGGLLWFAGIILVRRLAVLQPPHLDWARPPMHRALGVAVVGGVGLLIFDPSWIGAARAVAEAVAVVLCVWGGGRGAVPAGVLALLLLAPGGHAAHVQPVAPAVLVDELHVVSAGMWAGGVLALARLRPPEGWRSSEGQDMLGRFGRVAIVAFAFTALTGVLRATEELASLSDLWHTAYGLVLIAKSVAVLAMLALALVTWRRGVPLARSDAALALAVMAATGILAAFPIPPGGA